ncbi:hypothetical protein Bca4012_082480 [Brassica carinata]
MRKSWCFKFKEGLLQSTCSRTNFMCWRLIILWNTTDQVKQKSSLKHFQRVSDLMFGGFLKHSELEMLRFSSFQSQAAEPTISLSKTLEEDGSEMVATVANLSHFVFGIVQLCLMSNRVTWRRHKTDNFEPVSASHGAVTTEVVLSESHRLLLLFKVWRRSYVNHA